MEALETFRLGRITLGVSGQNAFARAVAAELDLAASSRSRPELVFRFSDSIRTGHVMQGEKEFSGRQIKVRLSWQDQQQPVVHVMANLPRVYQSLPRSFFKLVHPAYIDQYDYAAVNFFYQVFNGLIQALCLNVSQSFVHVSAVEKDGNRIAVISGGGMGKTGSLLRLVVDHGWRYLSDDWTILDDKGTIQLSHKSIQVHPRNLNGLTNGETLLLSNRGLLDRAAWKIRRRLNRQRGLKRKSNPVALLGPDRVGSPGPLSGAYLVTRGDVDKITEDDAGPGQLSSHAAAITVRELAPSLSLLEPHLVNGVPESLRLLELPRRTEAVLHRGLHGVRLRVVTVPRAMPEPKIEDYLVRTVASGGSR